MSELTLYCVRRPTDQLFVCMDQSDGVLLQTSDNGEWGQVVLSTKDARTLAEYLLLQLPSEQTNEH